MGQLPAHPLEDQEAERVMVTFSQAFHFPFINDFFDTLESYVLLLAWNSIYTEQTSLELIEIYIPLLLEG